MVDVVWKDRKRIIFGLPWTFTKYGLSEDRIFVETGFFNLQENEVRLYRIMDVSLERKLWQRMFGLGTITCYTGDTTSPELKIMHIKNAKAVKNFILEQSEIARRKRRTMNTLDIGAGSFSDMDDVEL